MLSSIQRDIFELRDPAQKAPMSGNDRSIQVHSCHSEMREVEVLHDQLLALLSDNPGSATAGHRGDDARCGNVCAVY